MGGKRDPWKYHEGMFDVLQEVVAVFEDDTIGHA